MAIDLGNEEYIRDLDEMLATADDVDIYVKMTNEKCTEILEMFQNAAAQSVLAGVAGEEFAQMLRTWVKEVQDSLPEGEGLATALREEVEKYWYAHTHLVDGL